jgi:hypothetical protein
MHDADRAEVGRIMTNLAEAVRGEDGEDTIVAMVNLMTVLLSKASVEDRQRMAEEVTAHVPQMLAIANEMAAAARAASVQVQ